MDLGGWGSGVGVRGRGQGSVLSNVKGEEGVSPFGGGSAGFSLSKRGFGGHFCGRSVYQD